MAETLKAVMAKLRRVLPKHFPKASLELETTESKRVAGLLIWPQFSGVKQIDRQDRLWDVLDKEFSKVERQQITALLTLTPDEMPSNTEK